MFSPFKQFVRCAKHNTTDYLLQSKESIFILVFDYSYFTVTRLLIYVLVSSV